MINSLINHVNLTNRNKVKIHVAGTNISPRIAGHRSYAATGVADALAEGWRTTNEQ